MSNIDQEAMRKNVAKMKAEAQLLIIDDMDEMRSILRSQVTDFGFNNIFEAADANSAINIAQSTFIDLAFLDINLPDLNGYDLLIQLKTINPDIFVIVVTGDASLENVRQAKSLRAQGFVSKPYRFDRVKPLLYSFYKEHYENN